METILLISPYWKEEHRWMARNYVEGKPRVCLPQTILSLNGMVSALGPGEATQRFINCYD
jgi:hypothetical protein